MLIIYDDHTLILHDKGILINFYLAIINIKLKYSSLWGTLSKTNKAIVKTQSRFYYSLSLFLQC